MITISPSRIICFLKIQNHGAWNFISKTQPCRLSQVSRKKRKWRNWIIQRYISGKRKKSVSPIMMIHDALPDDDENNALLQMLNNDRARVQHISGIQSKSSVEKSSGCRPSGIRLALLLRSALALRLPVHVFLKGVSWLAWFRRCRSRHKNSITSSTQHLVNESKVRLKALNNVLIGESSCSEKQKCSK